MKRILFVCLLLAAFASISGAQTIPSPGPGTAFTRGAGGGAPTFVQYAYAEQAGSGGTTVNLTSSNTYKFAWASSLGAGHYVVCALNNSASTTAQSLTFSPSLTVTGLTGNPFSGAAITTVWTAPSGSGGANTNTSGSWTTTSPYDSMACAEYSSVNSSTPTDAGGSAICSSTTVVSNAVSCSVTTTGTNEKIVTFCALNVGGSVMQPGTGETTRVGNSVNSSITNGILLEEISAPTAGTYATGCSAAGTATAGGVVSFAFNHA
jgi:hypothetical protein